MTRQRNRSPVFNDTNCNIGTTETTTHSISSSSTKKRKTMMNHGTMPSSDLVEALTVAQQHLKVEVV